MSQDSAIEWQPIPGRPSYEVTRKGDLRSWKSGSPRVLKQIVDPRGGYRHVFTYEGGVQRKLRVHHAVLLTFVGPRPRGSERRHINGNPADNSLTNLAWGTPLENTQDKRDHGTIPRGERAAAARLTEADVYEIRRLHGSVSLRQLGRRFGVSHTAIRRAALGIKWGHVG